MQRHWVKIKWLVCIWGFGLRKWTSGVLFKYIFCIIGKASIGGSALFVILEFIVKLRVQGKIRANFIKDVLCERCMVPWYCISLPSLVATATMRDDFAVCHRFTFYSTPPPHPTSHSPWQNRNKRRPAARSLLSLLPHPILTTRVWGFLLICWKGCLRPPLLQIHSSNTLCTFHVTHSLLLSVKHG